MSVSKNLYLDYTIDIAGKVFVYIYIYLPFSLAIKANFLSSLTHKIILEIVVTNLYLILKLPRGLEMMQWRQFPKRKETFFK